MDESSIWAAALLDILDVVPRYRLHKEIATMSPLELRRNALEISKLYHMWTKRVAPPKSVTRHPLPVDASRIDLLPGGGQLLILTSKGDLQLYDFPGTFELVATVARNDALDIVPAGAQLRRAKSPPSNINMCPHNHSYLLSVISLHYATYEQVTIVLAALCDRVRALLFYLIYFQYDL